MPTPISTEEFEATLARLAVDIEDPAHGLFGPDSMMWRFGSHNVNFICSWRAVLLQLAHPWVAAAVRDHSKVKTSVVRRFHGTFQKVFGMIYGDLDHAFRLARGLHAMHIGIQGPVADAADHGIPNPHERYSANTLEPMTWVYATLWETLIVTNELIWGPIPLADKEAFYQETFRFALLFGIPRDSLPPDWESFLAYNHEMWTSDQLRVTPAARDMASFVGGLRVFPGSRYVCKRGRAFAAMTLPENLRVAFDLPEPTPKLRASVERDLRRLHWLDRRLPKTFKLSPPYQEARCRIEGRRSPGPVIQTMNWISLGKRRVVS